MGDIGFSELVAIVIIAILLYGKDLPQAARKLANLYSKFRRQITDLKDELHRQIPAEELKMDPALTSFESVEPPQPPHELRADPTAEHVLLTWASALGATSYTVKRSAGPDEPMLVLAMYLTDLSYTDTDIAAGKTYHYTVTASNTAGESGNSQEAVCTVPGGQGQGDGQGQGTTAAGAPPAPAAATPDAPPPPAGETPGPAPAGGI